MINIRAYKPDDNKSCIEMYHSNMPLYFAPEELNYLKNWLKGLDEGRLVYETNLAEHYYVAEIENKVIAAGGFYITKNGNKAHMSWGMVHNNYHKQGIGKELLLFRINTIKQLYPNCKISLDTSQHTFTFFQKLGFTVTKITENGYGEGLHRYDMEC